MSKYDKEILAINRVDLFRKDNSNHFQGFSPSNLINYSNLILKHKKWMRRGDIEDNPIIKHPISYCMIVNPEIKKVFSYIRSDKEEHYTEKRLHGKLSIGIGGHIEKGTESDSDNPIISAMLRELDEEVDIRGTKNPKVLGYINDDNQYKEDNVENKISVGRVHFGLLYLIETDAIEVLPKDNEIAEGKLRNFEELSNLIAKPEITIETWTQIALKPLKEYFDN